MSTKAEAHQMTRGLKVVATNGELIHYRPRQSGEKKVTKGNDSKRKTQQVLANTISLR